MQFIRGVRTPRTIVVFGNRRDFWRDESGATVVEYVLLVAVLALGVIVALMALRDGIGMKMMNDSSSIEKAH
jgi:Flp pilus assembly pilin Flp